MIQGTMNKKFELLKATRVTLMRIVDELSLDELNKIPAGFNNNIFWNVAHFVAGQQGLCYRRAGVKPLVDDEFFIKYGRDTKPQGPVDYLEVDRVKNLLVSTIEKLAIDYKQGLFANYEPWVNMFGVEIRTIDDALDFLLFHEGTHFGYLMALRRTVIH
jgi:hypothetical protein